MYVISTEVEKSLQYDRNTVEVTENKYVIDARTRRICLLVMPSCAPYDRSEAEWRNLHSNIITVEKNKTNSNDIQIRKKNDKKENEI